MKVIVNYPTDKRLLNDLNERIDEFRATLIVEAVKRLDVSCDNKKKILDKIVDGFKSGKYSA